MQMHHPRQLYPIFYFSLQELLTLYLLAFLEELDSTLIYQSVF